MIGCINNLFLCGWIVLLISGNSLLFKALIPRSGYIIVEKPGTNATFYRVAVT